MKEHALIVIGGGAAGLTAAEAAAVLGIDVALVEGHKMGGDCTWYGCIPSKAILHTAKVIHDARSQEYLETSIQLDFARLMDSVQETIHAIYHEESPAALRERGLTVYEAHAKFIDPHTIELSTGETLRARKFILATGAKNRELPGFADVPYLTNHTLFDLRELPPHLLIVGGGSVAVEMAQAFRRLGSDVTIMTDTPHLLPQAEPEAVEILEELLRSEGVTLYCGSKAVSASQAGEQITVTLANGSNITGSHLLLAVGKVVDVRKLNPDAAEIAHDAGRLLLNPQLQTSQPHIFAAGDAAGAPMLSHASSAEATTALINAVSPIRSRRKTIMPWAIFTDPEIAQAGYTEAQLQQMGKHYEVTRLPITRADRAMTDGQRQGFMKLLHTKYGKLLGATIVGPNAGEMMNEWVRIFEKGGRVLDASTPTHIYPTLGVSNAILATEQLRKLAANTWIGRIAKWIVRRLI